MKRKAKKIMSLVLSLTILSISLFALSPFSASAASNEEEIFNFCINEMGLNTAAACGVLANIKNESNFNPNAVGDGGTSYGICQWHLSRYTNLKNYCNQNGYSYTSLTGQLYFLRHELSASYGYIYDFLKCVSNNENGAYDAGYTWCYEFERPANKGSVSVARGNLAKNTYWPIYGGYIPPDPFVVVNYPTPISAYPAATSGKVSVFNANLSEYSQSTRYIAWNDLCTINAIYTNGYCSVTYPTSNGLHTEYARTSDFIPNGVSPYAWRPDGYKNTYIRSDMSTVFGAISSADGCTVVGKSGNRFQIIYPLDSGGYKLGWVDATAPPPSDFPTPMIGYTASSGNIYAHASLDSMGDDYGQIFPDDRCTLTSVNVSGGWIYVTYPISGGSKSGYVYLNDFVPDSSRLTHFVETTVTQQSDAFRKSDMAVSIGWVSANDPITVVGKSGNKLQVLYPVDEQYGGGYKIAWIYDTYIKKNLTGISIGSNPSKTEYLEGENLNTNGLVVNAHYDDGSTSNITGSCSFSGYSSTPGVKTITVSYGGKQTAFTVSVKSKSPTSLTIKTLPSKTSYEIGEAIDTSGLTTQVSFDNGTNSTVKDIDIFYDDNITSTAGDKTISVNYYYNNKTVSTSFFVTILEADPTSPTNPTNPVTPTNPVNPDDSAFIVSSVSETSGATVSVDVSIQNNPGITALKINLAYPTEVLTLKNVEYKSLFSSYATGSNKMNSPFTISWFSDSSSNESANGVLATLTFEISNDAEEGTYPIELSFDPDDVFDSYFDNVEFAVSNGAVVVANSIPGDTNGDKKVNMKDIVFLQQYLNGWNVTIDTKAADVNGDSKVNMKDIVLLQQYMNGWNVVLK